MKKIKLTRNEYTIVDDEDFESLNQFKWHYSNGYARRAVYINGKQKIIFMHRLIAQTPMGQETDHIDRNGLNNQKYNLRNVNHAENTRNATLRKDNKSGHRGVYFHAKTNKYVAQFRRYGQNKTLGYYGTLEQAAKAHEAILSRFRRVQI